MHIMTIYIELAKLGLQWIINCNHNVGEYLFEAISYLFKYIKTSKIIWQNNMFYFKICLNLEALEAIECHKWLFKFDFLHDLHGGQANDEQTYKQKMLLSTSMVDYGEISLQYLYIIHFILCSTWICICNENLLNCYLGYKK
jgi:hypothetical protein